MEINGKAVYFVAVKLLIRDGDKLLITHDIFDNWDIPGGRIKEHEFGKPLQEVAARKLSEELGDDVRVEVGEPAVFFSVRRVEHGLDEEVSIFAVGLEARYLSGELQLGEHHDKYEWVDIDTFKPEKLFSNGWEIGLEEYINKEKNK